MEDDIIRQYENELALAKQSQPTYNPYASAMFSGQNKQNLIEWELDFKPELEDIERLLRCDVLITDNKNNEHWARNPDQSKVFLNEAGVNDILRKIRLLVNKNKVLSYYQIDEINKRVKMIMNELRVLIYNNYEQYGIDNEYKMNNYSMVVLTIGSLIEDAYRRALNGETHKGLADQRLVTQNDNVAPTYNTYQNQPQSKKHWWNPLSWNK